jgi:hypothetical protein
MKTSLRNIRIAAGLVAAIALTQLAGAASYTWNVTSGNWSTSTSWTPNTGAGGPLATDSTIFGNNDTTTSPTTINNTVDAGFAGTISSLTYNSASTSPIYHVTQIPSGRTLIASGSVLVGGVNQSTPYITYAYMTGGGTFEATGTSFTVQNYGSASGANATAYLNLSNLNSFVYNNTSGTIGIGNNPGALTRLGGNLILAGVSNNITATTINLATSTAAQAGPLCTFVLGAGTNIINVANFNIANNKNSGTVSFAAPTGGLRVRGVSGADTDRANITIGNRNQTGTGTCTGTMALNGSPLDIKAGTLTIGANPNTGTTTGDTGTGVLQFDTGTVDATTIIMATSATASGAANGTITVGANGTLIVGTGGLSMVNQAASGACAGTLNISNGTVICNGSISAVTTTGTSTISVTGGTLIVTNISATIGSSAAPISTLNLSGAVLNLTPSTGGPTINVAALNSAGSTNTINIFSLPNISSYPVTLHLVSYTSATGNNALIGLGSLPAASPAFQGSIVDNGAGLDLVLTAGPQNGPPSPPTGLGGAAIADGQIALSWNASLGATSYNVLRSTTSGSGYSTLATNITATSYTDATAADGVKRYYYEVTAVNSNGTSSASAEVGVLAALQLEFGFEDTGTTTTDSVSGATLALVNGANSPTDLHGAAGSGVDGIGKALDFSSNPYDSPTTGPLASVVNNSTLGFGTVTNFTVTFWVEPDSDFLSVASSATNNPRLFTLAPGSASDYGANPGISLSVNNWNGTAPQTNGIKMNLNGTQTTSVNFHTLPHYWTFVALTYDGTQLRLYSGSSLTSVELLGSQANAGQALNFGAAGTLLIGNGANLSKSVDAWFDDFRFYAVAASTNLLESIRLSSAIIGLSNLYPNGSLLLQGTNTLAFTATSPNGINANGFHVILNGLNVSSQLAVGGTTGSRTVTYSGLQSNQLYTASITITDAAGAFAAMQYGFDTFSSNSYTWEAEDFDYYSGQFIDNPQIDAYMGLAGTLEVDEHVPSQPTGALYNYRTSNDVGTDLSPDTPRLQYLTPQPTNDYYVGWWPNGGWLNYTRTYPAGVFNIYARLSGGIGPSTVTLSQVLSGQGSSSQTTSNLGTFSFSGSDWNTYTYVPLRDGFGNLLAVTLGGVETLRLTTDGAANANFLLLAPAQLTLPVIANVYPDGLELMEPASSFTFTASSANTTINNSGIQLVLNGTNVSSQLLIAGSSTSKTVTYSGLSSNMAYTAVITVTDANGTVATSTINFDTFNPTLVWEAEDYDFQSGQFIDNPTPTSVPEAGSYFGQYGTPEVDYYDVTTGTSPHLYRPIDAVSTDLAGDTPRQKFLDAQVSDPNVKDYEVGYFTTGEWLNFTRTFPAGTYNIYARLAENAGVTGSASLSLVTSGWGTVSQTTTPLGTFSFTGAGWQTYKYAPLYDSFGNLARITLNGTNTLRLTSATSGGVNANFLMAVPQRTDLPIITSLYPDGTSLFQATNKLVFTVSSPSGINTANIHLVINGVDVSAGLTFTGSSTAWTVTYAGLLPNTTYTVTITATDNSGNVVRGGSTFDTFSSAYFTWEAEDFDFNGGQFIDNPVVSATPTANCYFTYPNGDPANVAQVGIDLTTPNNASGEQFVYRPNESCGTQVAQDLLRAQFSAAGASDYNVGWWTAGTWLNYTRTFPTNTYNLYARLAYNAAYSVTVSLVTGGWGTPDQATQVLGTFSGTGTGFQAWQWVPLLDAGAQPVAVALGGVSTLKMTAGTSVNANFYMLVPATTPPANVVLAANLSETNVVLSFPTVSGFTYTILTKSNLSDATWMPLTSVSGDGSPKSVNDPATAARRFYRLSIQ